MIDFDLHYEPLDSENTLRKYKRLRYDKRVK